MTTHTQHARRAHTGAFNAALYLFLRYLARLAATPSANDTTPYGESRASTTSFYPFHAAAISAAVAAADSDTIRADAAHRLEGLSSLPPAAASRAAAAPAAPASMPSASVPRVPSIIAACTPPPGPARVASPSEA